MLCAITETYHPFTAYVCDCLSVCSCLQRQWLYKCIKAKLRLLESMQPCVCCTCDYVRIHAHYIQIQATADK